MEADLTSMETDGHWSKNRSLNTMGTLVSRLNCRSAPAGKHSVQEKSTTRFNTDWATIPWAKTQQKVIKSAPGRKLMSRKK
jgi:hypothetical protein